MVCRLEEQLQFTVVPGNVVETQPNCDDASEVIAGFASWLIAAENQVLDRPGIEFGHPLEPCLDGLGGQIMRGACLSMTP